MAHIRQSIRDNAMTAVTGLSTTGSNVFRSRVYPLGTNKLPACVSTRKRRQWNTPAWIGQGILTAQVKDLQKDLDAIE